MNIYSQLDTDLVVRSFAHVAEQLATAGQHDHIFSEAEKHRSALRLMQRDVAEMAEQQLRRKMLTKVEFHQLRDRAAQKSSQAQDAITRIAAQYVPHKLAA